MTARDPLDVHTDDIQTEYDDRDDWTPDPKDLA